MVERISFCQGRPVPTLSAVYQQIQIIYFLPPVRFALCASIKTGGKYKISCFFESFQRIRYSRPDGYP